MVRPAKIAIANKGNVIAQKVFPGITEASRKAVLAFRVSGQIVELPVRAGQALKKGALIARLEQSTYRNTLADRKATFDLTKIELDRQQKLYDQKHVAKSKLDVARTNFEAASAALKQAQDDLRYTRLTAPYDGMMSRIDVEAFQNIQAKEPIAAYQGTDNIDVVFNVPEDIFLRVNRENTNGGHVLVRFDSLPGRTFDAYYREHDTLPDTQTRSFKVTVSMPLPKDLTVLPGMSVSVIVDLTKIMGGTTSGVLVPVEAVFEDAGQTWVWKLDAEDAVRKTQVTVEKISGESAEVIEGLSDGDRVVAAGVSYLSEGQKVRSLKKERGL